MAAQINDGYTSIGTVLPGNDAYENIALPSREPNDHVYTYLDSGIRKNKKRSRCACKQSTWVAVTVILSMLLAASVGALIWQLVFEENKAVIKTLDDMAEHNCTHHQQQQTQLQEARILQQDERIQKQDKMIQEQDKRIQEQDERILEQDKMMQEQDKRMQEQDKRIQEQDKRIQEQDERIQEQDKMIQKQDERIQEQANLLQLAGLHQMDQECNSTGGFCQEVIVVNATDRLCNGKRTFRITEDRCNAKPVYVSDGCYLYQGYGGQWGLYSTMCSGLAFDWSTDVMVHPWDCRYFHKGVTVTCRDTNCSSLDVANLATGGRCNDGVYRKSGDLCLDKPVYVSDDCYLYSKDGGKWAINDDSWDQKVYYYYSDQAMTNPWDAPFTGDIFAFGIQCD